MYQKITLVNLDKPKEENVKRDINWFCNSFGLCCGRDTENMSEKIISYILSQVAKNKNITSESIADNLNSKIHTINHHIRSLIDSGLIYREKRQIYLRQGSVKAAVEEMRRDANRMFDNLSLIGEEIDNSLGLKNR